MSQNTSKIIFYIYWYFDLLRDDYPYGPRDPIYVGKGTGNRKSDHLREPFISWRDHFHSHLRIMLSQGNNPLIESEERATDLCSLESEKYEISKWGTLYDGTGCLYNMTKGGQGLSGHIWSPESRLKMSISMSGKQTALGIKRSDAFCEGIRQRMLGNQFGVGGKASRGWHHPKRTPIGAFRGNALYRKFDCIQDAKKLGGFDLSSIYDVLSGRKETYHGMEWKRL